MKLRFIVRRIETRVSIDRLDDDAVEEFSAALWDLALEIEEGDLSDALARLRRAQDRLSEAIENGATDEEIAELMQELREAMQDYMRQLAQQQGDQQQELAEGEMQEMSSQDLQDMLDGFSRMEALATRPELIVPGHDPKVCEVFATGVADHIFRLDPGPVKPIVL